METTAPPCGQAELVRGLRLQADGPAQDACATLGLARAALAAQPGAAAPAVVEAASLGAVEAAWAAGDVPACLDAVRSGLEACAAHAGSAHDYLRGLHALLEGHLEESAQRLRRVHERAQEVRDPGSVLLGATAALLTGDVAAACRAGARALAAAHAAGDPAAVARATECVAYAELRAGRHAQAREHAVAGWHAARRSGRVNTAAHHRAVLALVCSVQGPLADVPAHAAAALGTARRHGLAAPATLAEWALARTELALGRPADAAGRLGSLLDPADGGAHFALRGLVLPTLVEAAAGAGDAGTARSAIPELAAWTRAAADPQGPALVLRCDALVAPDAEQTDDLYRRAHAAHLGAAGDFERARTLLLHGMWLRRRRRPVDARRRLRDALQLLERCGATPWLELAAAEQRATGGVATTGTASTAGRSSPVGLEDLTPHQRRIARCVADGATNREIAARLSVSVRTVDCHLRNIFVALGVRSRVELARRASDPGP
jgi:DNA-binding CsgD family transcriptional regulator